MQTCVTNNYLLNLYFVPTIKTDDAYFVASRPTPLVSKLNSRPT